MKLTVHLFGLNRAHTLRAGMKVNASRDIPTRRFEIIDLEANCPRAAAEELFLISNTQPAEWQKLTANDARSLCVGDVVVAEEPSESGPSATTYLLCGIIGWQVTDSTIIERMERAGNILSRHLLVSKMPPGTPPAKPDAPGERGRDALASTANTATALTLGGT